MLNCLIKTVSMNIQDQKKLVKSLEYFTENPKVRRNSHNDSCFYSGKTTKKKNKGCLVGYFLSPKTKLEWDRCGFFRVIDYKIKELTAPKIIEDNLQLFNNLQSLHDGDSNWGIKGLSDYGKGVLKNIINSYNLDKNLFQHLIQ